MNFAMDLSPDEIRAVEDSLAALSANAKHKVSLKQLVQKWVEFVTQIEQGYADSIYEYTNDLSSRDLLEELLGKVPSSLRHRIEGAIGPLDVRFMAATKQSRRSLSLDEGSSLQHWWFRVPNKLLEELENDLRVEGIVE